MFHHLGRRTIPTVQQEFDGGESIAVSLRTDGNGRGHVNEIVFADRLLCRLGNGEWFAPRTSLLAAGITGVRAKRNLLTVAR